ncbi:MAG TPA: hypothetical protein VN026_08440, partial [Bacteroidia bacterium]|nr:hypothetical protein [Bacteroidia bacterium]
MEFDKSQIQKVEESYKNNSLLILKNEPLLFYPYLTDTDINDSVIDDLDKQVILASLNYKKIKDLQIIKGESGQKNSETYDELID